MHKLLVAHRVAPVAHHLLDGITGRQPGDDERQQGEAEEHEQRATQPPHERICPWGNGPRRADAHTASAPPVGPGLAYLLVTLVQSSVNRPWAV